MTSEMIYGCSASTRSSEGCGITQTLRALCTRTINPSGGQKDENVLLTVVHHCCINYFQTTGCIHTPSVLPRFDSAKLQLPERDLPTILVSMHAHNVRRSSPPPLPVMAPPERERPFRCSYCVKTFGRLGHRKRHELTHANTSTHHCAACGKGFGRR